MAKLTELETVSRIICANIDREILDTASVGKLVSEISADSNVTIQEIWDIVFRQDFMCDEAKDITETINKLTTSIENQLDNFRGKLIYIAGRNIDIERSKNTAILNQKIRSLEWFLEEILNVEDYINVFQKGAKEIQKRGVVFNELEDSELENN